MNIEPISEYDVQCIGKIASIFTDKKEDLDNLSPDLYSIYLYKKIDLDLIPLSCTRLHDIWFYCDIDTKHIPRMFMRFPSLVSIHYGNISEYIAKENKIFLIRYSFNMNIEREEILYEFE
jgi:hypothetical protein